MANEQDAAQMDFERLIKEVERKIKAEHQKKLDRIIEEINKKLARENEPENNKAIATLVINEFRKEEPSITDEQADSLKKEVLETLEQVVPPSGKNDEKSSKALKYALTAGKIALAIGVAGATLWFAGPACAIAGRAIYSSAYVALYGTPGYINYFLFFLPGKEWAGYLAFTYGPALLSLPTAAVVGLGTTALEKTTSGLYWGASKVGSAIKDKISNTRLKDSDIKACIEALDRNLKAHPEIPEKTRIELIGKIKEYVKNGSSEKEHLKTEITETLDQLAKADHLKDEKTALGITTILTAADRKQSNRKPGKAG